MKLPDDTLAAALSRHRIELPEPQIGLLEKYCALVWEWNEKINLTRHTDYEKFVGRDVIDSLAFAEFIGQGEKVLDVGSGGGVPGAVLAIVRPDLSIVLSDSTGKKAKVLEDIVARLGLKTPVFHGSAQDLLKRKRFDTLTVRAVAPLKKLLEWFKNDWNAFGRLLVLKGPAWIEERGEARHFGLLKNLALRKLKSYPLPGTESDSVLLAIGPRPKA
ncbi:MAG: 16S rRNA (guanine(527)-N(7))-methyltransferase RsmG [Pirellulales bacterium]|nr:16S rRNA (guanine(527)-N(7))-methyltransferase RsmG [Pirellulales bacterium]